MEFDVIKCDMKSDEKNDTSLNFSDIQNKIEHVLARYFVKAKLYKSSKRYLKNTREL